MRTPCFLCAPPVERLPRFRTPTPFLDPRYRVVSALGGQPGDPRWKEDVNDTLAKFFDECREAYSFKAGTNRRVADDYRWISYGLSFGGGQQVREAPL